MKIEEAYVNLITAIEEMINTTTSVTAPYPVDVIGRPSPFGKNKVKKSKKSSGEKRAPHTELMEKYKKENKHREHPAMYKYSYKKCGKLGKTGEEIAKVCEAIIAESEVKDRLKGKIATLKSERRNAQKIENETLQKLHKTEKDPYSKAYPIRSMMLKDIINRERSRKNEASDKVKELADKRDKIN